MINYSINFKEIIVAKFSSYTVSNQIKNVVDYVYNLLFNQLSEQNYNLTFNIYICLI